MKALSTDSIQKNHHNIIIYLNAPTFTTWAAYDPTNNFLVVNNSHLIELELAGLAETTISGNYAVLLWANVYIYQEPVLLSPWIG
jgi:hypothetical protein